MRSPVSFLSLIYLKMISLIMLPCVVFSYFLLYNDKTRGKYLIFGLHHRPQCLKVLCSWKMMMLRKSVDRFLYGRDLCHERVNSRWNNVFCAIARLFLFVFHSSMISCRFCKKCLEGQNLIIQKPDLIYTANQLTGFCAIRTLALGIVSKYYSKNKRI